MIFERLNIVQFKKRKSILTIFKIANLNLLFELKGYGITSELILVITTKGFVG